MVLMAAGTRVAMVVVQPRRPHDIVIVIVVRLFASEEPAEEPEWSAYKGRDEIEIINPICFKGLIESHDVVVCVGYSVLVL
jgi:hypothetical protein